MTTKHLWCITAAGVLGAGGVIAQVLLWKELLAVYQGNELTTGIILANWLLAEATGALITGKWRRMSHRPFAVFAVLSGLFAVGLPAAMTATRLLRPWLGIAIGQPVGPVFTLVSSMIILAPVSFLHGALFPTMGRLYRDALGGRQAVTVGMLYVWESVGTLLGALLLMIHSMTGGHGFRLVAFVWVINGLVLSARGRGTRRAPANSLFAAGMLAAALLALLVLAAGADRVDAWSTARQHRPYRVLGGILSPYGKWTVLDSDGQFLFIADGQPTYLTPVPDRVEVEELAHLPLLLHANPRHVCVIGGGVGGLLDEILKHPSIDMLDYTELDPAVFKLFDRFATQLTARELGDPRVSVHARDGRQFLQRPGPLYDVIWIGASEPATLHANRYFTQDFFTALRRRLAPDGILVLASPGSLAHASDDLRRLQAGIFASLRRAFDNARLLPGDGRFIYLASPALPLAEYTAQDMANRLYERDMEKTLGMPWHLEQRLHPGWLAWFEDEYRDVPMEPNRDLRPLALFHMLAHHQSVHAPRSAAFMRGLRRHGWATGMAVLGLLLIFRIQWARRHPAAGSAAPVVFRVATTGFAGMLLDLLVIFSFQSAFGHIHVWIGLLMAAFMAGAAAGATLATDWASRTRRLAWGLQSCDALMCGFCAILPLLLNGAMRLAPVLPAAAIALFLAVNLAAGVLTGLLFPLAAAWRAARGDDAGHTAGLLQTADLAGGWLAGLAGATLLLPIWGVYGACAALIAIKSLSLLPIKAKMQT